MKKLIVVFALVMSSRAIAMERDLILPPINITPNKKQQIRDFKKFKKMVSKKSASPVVCARMQINGEEYRMRGTRKSITNPVILQALTVMTPNELSFLEKPRFVTSK